MPAKLGAAPRPCRLGARACGRRPACRARPRSRAGARRARAAGRAARSRGRSRGRSRRRRPRARSAEQLAQLVEPLRVGLAGLVRVDAERREDAVCRSAIAERLAAGVDARPDRDDPRRPRPSRARATSTSAGSAHASRCAWVSITRAAVGLVDPREERRRRLDSVGLAASGRRRPARARARPAGASASRIRGAVSRQVRRRARPRPRGRRRRGRRGPRSSSSARASSFASCHGAVGSTWRLSQRDELPDRPRARP